MTTTTHHSGQSASHADFILIGTLTQINRATREAHAKGKLIFATTPQPVGAIGARYRAQLRLRANPYTVPDVRGNHDLTADLVGYQLGAPIRRPTTLTRPHRHRHYRSAGILAVIAIVLATAGFLAGYLDLGAGILAKALAVLFGLALIAGLLAVLPAIASGGRHHCPGCRH